MADLGTLAQVSPNRLKQVGKKLHNALDAREVPQRLTHCHEAMARGFGFRTYADFHATGGTDAPQGFDVEAVMDRLILLNTRELREQIREAMIDVQLIAAPIREPAIPMEQHMPATGDLSYYIDEYTDEVIPCLPTLEGWAAWLAKPDREWRRDEAAADGERFKASVTRWGTDLIATRNESGGWDLFEPEGLAEASILAVRFGKGLGWDPDNIAWTVEDLREILADADEQVGAVEYVAVGFDEPAVTLIYRADPPRMIVEKLQ